MRTWITAAWMLAIAVMPSVAQVQPAPPDQPAAPATPAPTVVMKLHTLTDKGSGEMPSHTILAPAEWKVEGGAWWPGPQFFKLLPSQDIKVTAPDGRMVHVGPSLGATDYRPSPMAAQQFGARRPQEGSADGGNFVMHMPDNLPQWKTFLLEKAFKTSFPKATEMRMENVVVIPELTAMLQKQIEPFRAMHAQSDQQARSIGYNQRSFGDGAMLAVKCFYTDEGKNWEHMLIFGTAQFGADTDLGRNIFWSIEPSVSYRAEAGQLQANMPLLMAVANSMRMTPQWSKMKSDHIAKMNQISAKGAADRANIIANSNREISKMINEGYESRMASMDRTHEAVIKSIRGVEDYTVAGSETKVQLPNTHSHIFTNNAGDYIMTNDSTYNPNTDPLFKEKTWDAMQQVKN